MLPSSSYPPHVHCNFPYGLGIRVRAIVNAPDTLDRRLDELSRFLRKRGFSASVINHQFAKVRSKPREEVLTKKRMPAEYRSSAHGIRFCRLCHTS